MMRLKRFTVIVLSLMMVLGCTVSVCAVDREPATLVNFRVQVVDKNSEPMSGIVMEMHSLDGYGISHATTDEDGKISMNVPPGNYTLEELGYEQGHTVYNQLYFFLGPLGQIKEDKNHRENVDFEIADSVSDYGLLIWHGYDYTGSYSVSVKLDGRDFDGDRVELLDSSGNVVKAWKLKDDGELLADLAPGAYTLREIVEINGYEMPTISGIMVGSGTLVPVKPLEPPKPDFISELPDYVYDDFHKWINQL